MKEEASVAAPAVRDAATREWQMLAQSQVLLRGEAIVGRRFPNASLQCLITALPSLNEADVSKMLGISDRTLRRQRETPMNPMPAALASKAWLLAETLAKASQVFGSRGKAEEWLSKPAMGLDGQRPIDLLQTAQGAELVNDFLTRLDYGVYC